MTLTTKKIVLYILVLFLPSIEMLALTTRTSGGIIYQYDADWGYAKVTGYTSNIGSTATIKKYITTKSLSGKVTYWYVRYIENGAFENCTSITSITVGDSIRSCPGGVFVGCTKLKTISVSSGNKWLSSSDGVLYNQDKTTLICYPPAKTDSSYVFPNTVTSISSYAFYGCKNLKSLTIPEHVTSIGSYPVSGCTLNPLLVYGSGCSLYGLYGLDKSSVVYQHYDSTRVAVTEAYYGNTNSRTLYNGGYTGYYYNGPIYFFEAPYIPEVQEAYVRGVKFAIKENEYYTGNGGTITGLSIDGHELAYNGLGTYTATGLDYFEEDSPCEILMTYANMDCYTRFIQPAALDSLVITPTQTTTTITVTARTDASIGVPKEAYIYHSTVKDTISFENNNPEVSLTIKDLLPNRKYGVNVYLVYDSSNTIKLDYASYYTKAVIGTLSDDGIGPTSLHSELDLNNGDFEIDSISWYYASMEGNVTTDYTDFVATGLTPETSYTIYCRAHNTDKNWALYLDTLTFTTGALSLVTEEPKVLSTTSASISAMTNIDDIEPNVGFEWRKIDAPDEVASKSATAEIYDGVLSGVIKGLSESTYYKYRAYYTSASDSTYYSDWVGIDTDDYSYFEPTVKTGDIEVSESSVTAKGYALQGTEDIEEQGFEYWVASSSAKSSRVSSKASDDGISKVIVDGQKMAATLTDLLAGTTYEIRAFATTASGTTYGETVQFTTAETTGISGVTADGSEELELLVRQNGDLQIAVTGSNKLECIYRIFSITGSMVASGKVSTDGNWHSVTDANSLKGVYVIIVSDGSETKTKKMFVK